MSATTRLLVPTLLILLLSHVEGQAPSGACSVSPISTDTSPQSLLPEGFTYLAQKSAFVLGNINVKPDKSGWGLALMGMDGIVSTWAKPDGMLTTFGIQVKTRQGSCSPHHMRVF